MLSPQPPVAEAAAQLTAIGAGHKFHEILLSSSTDCYRSWSQIPWYFVKQLNQLLQELVTNPLQFVRQLNRLLQELVKKFLDILLSSSTDCYRGWSWIPWHFVKQLNQLLQELVTNSLQFVRQLNRLLVTNSLTFVKQLNRLLQELVTNSLTFC